MAFRPKWDRRCACPVPCWVSPSQLHHEGGAGRVTGVVDRRWTRIPHGRGDVRDLLGELLLVERWLLELP
jgi:hypothetical protein